MTEKDKAIGNWSQSQSWSQGKPKPKPGEAKAEARRSQSRSRSRSQEKSKPKPKPKPGEVKAKAEAEAMKIFWSRIRSQSQSIFFLVELYFLHMQVSNISTSYFITRLFFHFYYHAPSFPEPLTHKRIQIFIVNSVTIILSDTV